jgi:hypothetical protein
VREFTNLQWPQTPFGADKRPFPHVVHLVAATAVQWADDGERAVPMAAAMLYLPVPRTGTREFEAATVHFGYRVVALERADDAPDVAAAVDGHLVQARRHAVAVAAHGYLDDARALSLWSPEHTAGITSVAEAWLDRSAVERKTAQPVETGEDLHDQNPALSIVCQRHGLAVVEGAQGLLRTGEVQAAYERMFAYDDDTPPSATIREQAVQTLAHGAVYQALAVALLAAKHLERGTWQRPFMIGDAVERETWDAFPHVFPETQPAVSAAG